MKKEKKDKIVGGIMIGMASVGGVLMFATMLTFAFNVDMLFGLFILGALLFAVASTIGKIYRDNT